jgi:hypothetical protein
MRESRHEPIAVLDLGRGHKLETLVSSPAIRPPEVPKEWKSLISLPRPREVYRPFWDTIRVFAGAAIALVSITLAVSAIRRHPTPLAKWVYSYFGSFAIAAFAVAALPLMIRGLLRELSNQSLLRDGEVTMGVITDWASGIEGKTAVYQFWTLTGERFQHEAPLYSDKEPYTDAGVVPVFYLPQDPTGSVALCCTKLRVRIPSEEVSASMQRIGMKR